MEECYPEKVDELTGVLFRQMVELAPDFAASKSLLARFGGEAACSTNELYTWWAIYCLNALKGNLEKPGGVFFPAEMPAAPSPEPEADAISGKAPAKARIV